MIGFVGLREVHLESPDPAQSAHVWRAITGSAESAAPEVALLIERGSELRVTALVFGVRNLGEAGAALTSLGVRTKRNRDVLWLDDGSTWGLRLGLIAD